MFLWFLLFLLEEQQFHSAQLIANMDQSLSFACNILGICKKQHTNLSQVLYAYREEESLIASKENILHIKQKNSPSEHFLKQKNRLKRDSLKSYSCCSYL